MRRYLAALAIPGIAVAVPCPAAPARQQARRLRPPRPPPRRRSNSRRPSLARRSPTAAAAPFTCSRRTSEGPGRARASGSVLPHGRRSRRPASRRLPGACRPRSSAPSAGGRRPTGDLQRVAALPLSGRHRCPADQRRGHQGLRRRVDVLSAAGNNIEGDGSYRGPPEPASSEVDRSRLAQWLRCCLSRPALRSSRIETSDLRGSGWPALRPPGPRRALRGGEPRLLRAFPGYPGEPRAVLGSLVRLRALRGRRVHRAVRLLAGPVTRPPRLAARRRLRFAHRRARRILPAYWAALGFSLAVAWLVVPPPGQGVPDAKSVFVNGLLVQNLVGAPSPNRSFWSMAVEAQLYVVFPLLLVMVRRWGAIVMVAAVTLVVATVGSWARASRAWTRSRSSLRPTSPRSSRSASRAPASWARARSPVVAVGRARARPRGARARDDLVAGLGMDARPPVLGRPRARPGHRVSPGRSGHRPYGPAPAPARREADPQPRPVVLQPLPHARPDRRRRLRAIVAGRVRQGVPAFVVSLALVVPLTIVFARVFASVFETPFWHRSRPIRAA